MFNNVRRLGRGLLGVLVFWLLLVWTGLQVLAAPVVIATIPVAGSPFEINANPVTNRIYVANLANSSVTVIDGSTNTVITSIPVGNSPFVPAINSVTNRVYVTNFGSNTVSVIDGATNAVIATVSVGNGPQLAGVNPATNQIYIGNLFDNSLSVIDGTTNAVITTIPVGSRPEGFALNPVTNRIYITNSLANSYTIVDATNNSVISTIAVPGGSTVSGVAVNPANNTIYITNVTANTVTVMNGATNTLITTIPVGNSPPTLEFNPTNNRFYVTNSNSNTVSVIDANTNTVVATVPVGNFPGGVGVNSGTNLVYISNQNSNTVSVIADLVQPTITKAFGAATIPFNGSTSLTFTITNPNPTDALSGVAFTDNLPAGLVVASVPNVANTCGGTVTATGGSGLVSLAGATLAANGNCTISLSVTGTTPGVKNNTTLPISASETGPGKASNTATLTVNTAADIALQKTVDNRKPNVNDNVTFTLTVTNNGPISATNVVVNDVLPASLLYVSNTAPSAGTVVVNGNTVTWNVGFIGNGGSATLQIVAQVCQSGAIINTITKTQTEPDPNSLNDQASVGLNAPTADLGVKKSVDNPTPKVGDNVTFSVTLTNAGPDDATGVVARDLLPSGLDYISATAPVGTTYNAVTGDWTVGNLANGQSTSLQIVAKVSQGATLTNIATKLRQDQYDFNLTNDAASVSLNPLSGPGKTVVKPADFIAQLRVSPDRLASTDPTNLISYTLTVKNIGEGRADHISIPFPIDPNLEVGYTVFSDPRMWVSAIITGPGQPYMQLNLPPLEPKQFVSAVLVFRPQTTTTPGATLFTRYFVHWDDAQKAGKKAGSNAVRFSLSEDGTNRDDTGGAVQLFDPLSTGLTENSTLSINGDFYAPYELVTLWYTDKDGVSVSLGALNADGEGKLTFMFGPKDLKEGESYIVAGRGVRSEVTGSSLLTINGS